MATTEEKWAAFADALKALAAAISPTPTVEAKAAEPKPAKVAKPAMVETPKPAPAPVAAPVAATPAAAPVATNGAGGDLQAQCRKAAKGYAEVYGREGLKDVLKKYTEGTLADVPAEKLPELLAALS